MVDEQVLEQEDDSDAVMDALLAHIGPLYPEGVTFTLVVCTGESQDVITNDADPQELLQGLVDGMKDEMDREVRARGCRASASRLVH